jgi:hypothetical protein
MLARPQEVPLPPVMPWNTFVSGLVDRYKATMVPDVINGVALQSVSPKLRSRILSGLRGLKLIADDGRAQPAFRTLVGSRGTGQWEVQLRVLMNNAYPYLAGLDLSETNSDSLRKAFRNHLRRDTENISKCEAFYLNMARAAGVRLSAALNKRVATSDSMAAIRAVQLSGERKPAPPSNEPKKESSVKTAVAEPAKSERDRAWNLVDLLDDEDMTDKERAAVLTLLAYVKRKATKPQ